MKTLLKITLESNGVGTNYDEWAYIYDSDENQIRKMKIVIETNSVLQTKEQEENTAHQQTLNRKEL